MNKTSSEINNFPDFQKQVLADLGRIDSEFSPYLTQKKEIRRRFQEEPSYERTYAPHPPAAAPLDDYTEYSSSAPSKIHPEPKCSSEGWSRPAFDSQYLSLEELNRELTRLETLPLFQRVTKLSQINKLRQQIKDLPIIIKRLDYQLEKLTKLDPKDQCVVELNRKWKNKYNLSLSSLETLEKDAARCRDQIYIKNAEIAVKQEMFRKRVCAALERASDDMFEISKIITPLLIGLVSAGTLQMNLTPLWVAALSFAISRMGVASLCVEKEMK